MAPMFRAWIICLGALAAVTFSLAPHAQPARAGAAALFKAAEAGNAAEIRKLLAQGVPVDAADSDGWTALMLAAGEGKLAAVQALVKGGADVNWAAKGGETALIVATASGHTAVVKYLLSEGADKTARTKQGLTAADVAERAKKPDLAKLLQVGGGRAAAGVARAGDSRAERDAKINAAAEAFKAGRNDEAAKLFQEVVAQDPQHAMAWHFLGQSLAAAGKKDEARAAYEKSLSLQPNGDLAERNTKMITALRKGVLSYPNGDRYEGDVVDGKAQGSGTLIRANGDRYEGSFANDQPNGNGVEWTQKLGERYEGDFVNGKWRGRGKLVAPAGTIEGSFADDLVSMAVWLTPDGRRFEGTLQGVGKGNMGGKGILTSATGERYEFEFEGAKVLKSNRIR